MTALENNNESVINHLLYDTSMIKKIIDTGNEGGRHVFETGQSLAKGFLVFIRKLANRIIELEKENAEI